MSTNLVPLATRIKPSLENDARLSPRLRDFLTQLKFRRENGISPKELPLENMFRITTSDMEEIRSVNRKLSGETGGAVPRVATPAQTRTEKPTHTWRERAAEAPLKFQTQNWFNGGKFDREQAMGEPGLMLYAGSINRKEIDKDSRLRPGFNPRNIRSSLTTVDTCLKRVVPDYRGGEAKSSLNTSFYQAVPFTGLGSGIGNIEVNNEMYYGETSRSTQVRNVANTAINRFEPLIRDDFQHPDNVVLPFPRGGIDTRNADKYSRKDQYKRI